MKICTKCKKTKKKEYFYFKDKNHKYLSNKCKVCEREEKKQRYVSTKGKWIYIIRIDEKIRYVGSTSHLMKRLSAHKNPNRRDGVISKARQEGIDLKGSKIEFYVCDLEKDMGLNMDEKDYRYYEHLLIKDFINRGEELLNILEESEFIDRERAIDEIPIGGFNFNKQSTFYVE